MPDEQIKIKLAALLGITVAEMEGRMDPKELANWIGFVRLAVELGGG